MDNIQVIGAAIHNLKKVNVTLPKGSLTVLTGVSGSGKSSLAFDILFEEGRRRYFHAIGIQNDGQAKSGEAPFAVIRGLPPAIAVEQRTIRQTNPRSIVGTRTKLLDSVKWLYAIEGVDVYGQKSGLPVETFSFNHLEGLCPICEGRGYHIYLDEKRVIRDPRKRLEQICIEGRDFGKQLVKHLPAFAALLGYSDWKKLTFQNLSEEARRAFLHGNEQFVGYIPFIRSKITTPKRKVLFEQLFASRTTCEACEGYRLGESARGVFLRGKHIGQICSMPFAELGAFMRSIKLEALTAEGSLLVSRILWKIGLIEQVGLSYLTMLRTIPSLSGGELQRLFLMHHLQSEFDSLLYIFDEPTAGLHESEKQALIEKMRTLTEAGNTVIVVEHDADVIRASDYVVELGPGAGVHGGTVLYEGAPEGLPRSDTSVLGPYLSNARTLPMKRVEQYREVNANRDRLILRHASLNNLQNLTVEIPLGVLVGIAGKSGSGKSTLISGTLVPLLEYHLNAGEGVDEIEGSEGGVRLDTLGWLDGWEAIDQCIVVSQAPIGRSRMSTPITYIEIWDKIRDLFASQPEAQMRGYTAGHFSFNTELGACSACSGEGFESMDLGAIGIFDRTCPMCEGTRYRREILEVTYKGRSIHDILSMSAEHACELFDDQRSIRSALAMMIKIGLGYLTLGQPAPTLSGGEAQRLKLAKALGKPCKSGVIYMLDEPTTGLGATDIEKLLLLLDELVEQGSSVIVTEHEPNILAYCDWLIEMGPGSGDQGGRLLAAGSPHELSQNSSSLIGPYLPMV
ncbi:excinuclease ABC subunit UvrA [Paenibacillus ginsengarvi]|uniref:UvrABC system protein A n=1 Tax=Paenibacillus ginsengarvi TaxID=400777 RepID=A0A3B0AMY6_9BACL|nr:excinuclease ABC subunit UvrA [Paenibacillus ginsengarvi]RKN60376.1 excinuclease ABC subunit UvrA [Paenibacillus ginsengarvi]